MINTTIVNLIGGPGVGKSTLAAEIFAEIKKRHKEAELALEFAKEKVWEESFRSLTDQLYIFAKQEHRIWRLNGKVDYVVTDSPILLSIYYNKEQSEHFADFVKEVYNKFNNKLYFIERTTVYQQSGRMQTEDEAKEVDIAVKQFLDDNNIAYKTIHVENAVEEILNDLGF